MKELRLLGQIIFGFAACTSTIVWILGNGAEATTLHQRVLTAFAKATGGKIVKCVRDDGIAPWPKEPPVCVDMLNPFLANKLTGPITGSQASSDFDAYKAILVDIPSKVFEPTSDLTVTFRGSYKIFWKPNYGKDCKEYVTVFWPKQMYLISYMPDRAFQKC